VGLVVEIVFCIPLFSKGYFHVSRKGNGESSRVQAGFRKAQLCAAGTTEICDFGLE
jgi:hypothetical protein